MAYFSASFIVKVWNLSLCHSNLCIRLLQLSIPQFWIESNSMFIPSCESFFKHCAPECMQEVFQMSQVHCHQFASILLRLKASPCSCQLGRNHWCGFQDYHVAVSLQFSPGLSRRVWACVCTCVSCREYQRPWFCPTLVTVPQESKPSRSFETMDASGKDIKSLLALLWSNLYHVNVRRSQFTNPSLSSPPA